MKKQKKKTKKRCRHNYGLMEYDGSDAYQVCRKCRMTRFKGERYAYGSRWKD